MSAAPVSFFARDHRVLMAGCDVPPLTSTKPSGQRDPMRQAQFIRSTTFHWALPVAGVHAVFIIVLFGFIYWKIDDYLAARSDIVINVQLDSILGMSPERRLEAIDVRFRQYPRRDHVM